MPSMERDISQDSEKRLSFQPPSSLSSNSDYGRALVPMWDSSDPERAPPPLPLNPGSPVASTSRPNTSSAIQSAHAALAEKARESAYSITPPPLKRPDTSPDRSLVKGAAHKRMQSLQPGSVRDLSHYLESKESSPSPTKSPEKSQSRPTTPKHSKELSLESKPEDKGAEKTPTPLTDRRKSLLDTPSLRQSLHKPHTSILGENSSPQSATMLALHSMPSRDSDMSLASVTNGSNAMMRTPQTFDAISNQILSLTSIATSLQREMTQLSRRSKDNATDLLSLKEATSSRDEDIRKSLRELVAGLSETDSQSSRTLYGSGMSGSLFLDNKPHNSPGPRGSKTFTLPRIPSPNSFAASLDRDSIASPPASRSESTASIALLEKILREMGTRDGQNHLISRLTEVADRLSQDHMSTAKKLEDLVKFIKDNSGSNALVAQGNGGNGTTKGPKFSSSDAPRLELDFDQHRPGPMTERVNALLNKNHGPGSQASSVLNDEFIKAIRNVKDSVAQGGGLTAEVKALVRELRGEVLGMGRELGRKIEESSIKADGVESDSAADKEEIIRVVHDGLNDLRRHMDKILRDQHRQTSVSAASNNQEIASALKSVVAGVAMAQAASRDQALDRTDIIEAVREAWESYKPDIEPRHIGLEREELLFTLKEGFQEYAPQYDNGATREEVFQAVVEGFKHFSPPRVEAEPSLSRDEILDAVRECLEEFEFPAAPPLPGGDLTRDDMVDAVKEGLTNFDFPVQDHSQDLVPATISRDDVFEAVKAAFEAAPIPSNDYSEQVLQRMQEIIDSMQQEFRAVSDEAKQNVAAHGRDTEQVLDATRDGLENLRSDIESYVDRVAGITEREDVLDGLEEHFSNLRAEIQVLASKPVEGGPLNSIKNELDQLRETMATSLVRGGYGIEKEEILDAFREGLDGLRADIERRNSNESVLSGTGEILDALHDGINDLRADVEKFGSKPVDMTFGYEILDSLKAGLEAVRAEIEQLRESGHGDREIAAITDGAVVPAENVTDVADHLKRNDIEKLEILITQLRIKVEALESMPPPVAEFPPGMIFKEDLIAMEGTLHTMQAAVANVSTREASSNQNAATKEDVEAIETLLRNTKAKIDDIDPEQAVKREHLDSVEAIIRDTQDTVNNLTLQMGDASTHEHIEAVETLVKEVIISLDGLKTRAAEESADPEKVSKTDVEAVEAVCLDVKAQIEQMVITDLATLATGDDLKNLVEMVKEFKDRVEIHAETNAKQFEERQAETVGVGERVTEIKTYLEEFKDALKEKFDEGSTGIDSLGKLLENLSESVGQNASVPDDIKALFEAMKTEFEKSNAGVVGVKLESDEKFQQTWDKLDTKLEEKFAELMTKYDDAQVAAEAKATAEGDKNAQAEAAVLSTKAVAEELKLLVDTLGTTLTDSIERMDEASKTVFSRVEDTFTRVEDTFTRVEETHAEAKAEHQLTREQVVKAHSVIESLQGHVNEHDPKVLQAVNNILRIVGLHFEHSKSSADSLREKIAEIPPPPEIPMLPEIPVVEKYDDTGVQEKLNQVFSSLTAHMQSDKEASEKLAKLEVLDKIHQQVLQTSSDVSNFVATQTKLITEGHENKEKELEATTIALEKQLTLKEHVEKEVNGLREEERILKDSVVGLRAEKEDLAHQKMRLAADVSSLETALCIRREELHEMEARAEGLERRILEGVLDHSRALMLSKSNKSRDAAMSLKRVPSTASTTTESQISGTSSTFSSTLTQSGVNIAMSGNRGIVHQPNSSSRRILSLSQIPNNAASGSANSTFKRSHSVKHPKKSVNPRKTSWGGRELNKENLALQETEEESEVESEGEVSNASTTRRTSGIGAESMIEGSNYSSEYTYSEGPTPMSEDQNPMVLYQEESRLAA